MKKIILFIVFSICFFNASNSQSIGILGTAISGYNAPDIDLIQTGQLEYKLENLTVTTGTVKFRQDNDWAINWGSTTFPDGVGVQNGPEIPIPAGTYNVYFKNTGLYGFFAHLNIGMIGTAVSASGFAGDDVNMSTSDGITFSLYYPLMTGDLKFRQDDNWTINWGANTFPSGTATPNGANIHVLAGTYLISFNVQTHEYTFSGTPSYPSIGIIGTAVSITGYTGDDTNLSTSDGITYTLSNYTFTNGTLKFRQDDAWTTNWGGTNFPNGTGILNSPNNIPVTAGTYDVTFNRSNGTYSFISNTSFPVMSLFGPAINSQLGYAAPGVDMSTTDGINYSLSGYYFSSGNAYFRQDNNSSLVWGSYTFPTGTATFIGPPIFIPSGEYFVTFNRTTGDYSFSTPSIGILGTALNGYESPDTDLLTTDGFSYTLSNLTLTNGTVKFRKDNLWTSNWGATTFPTGTGTQNGENIPVAAGVYNVSFNKTTGDYNFQNVLGIQAFKPADFSVYSTSNEWTLVSANDEIVAVRVFDISGKEVLTENTISKEISINTSALSCGIYFTKIATRLAVHTLKVMKN